MLNIPTEFNLNIFHDDILHSIFTFTPTFELVLVCERWYNIIAEKNKCDVCGKIANICENKIWITDEGDVCCHMARNDDKDYKILDVEFINTVQLKHVFSILEKNISEIDMRFFSNKRLCIKYDNTDTHMTFNIKLNKNCFDKFKIKHNNINIHFWVRNLHEILKNIDDNIMLKISIYKSNHIVLNWENIEYKFSLCSSLKFPPSIPNKIGYNTELTINSKILVDDLKKCSRYVYVTFEIYQNKLNLIAHNYGDIRFAYIKITYILNNTAKENFKIKITNKYLLNTIKENPYGDIKLCFKKDFPLLITYPISTFGNFDIFLSQEIS